jgi:anthranilate synthase/aminodeoxychorismate synthase-like glutamine amidotransferase
MILVIDNYDSFVFNLVQYLGELGREPRVVRNDSISVEEITHLRPTAIVISPGPGRPEHAGIIVPAVQELAGKIPILGVCLGHQAIGAAFGGKVVAAPSVMHGKSSEIFHDGRTIFAGLENPFRAARYHSLVVSAAELPGCLAISARTADGLIMGLRHREHVVEGVQFHPESVLTDGGRKIIANFVSLAAPAAGPSRNLVESG